MNIGQVFNEHAKDHGGAQAFRQDPGRQIPIVTGRIENMLYGC